MVGQIERHDYCIFCYWIISIHWKQKCTKMHNGRLPCARQLSNRMRFWTNEIDSLSLCSSSALVRSLCGHKRSRMLLSALRCAFNRNDLCSGREYNLCRWRFQCIERIRCSCLGFQFIFYRSQYLPCAQFYQTLRVRCSSLKNFQFSSGASIFGEFIFLQSIPSPNDHHAFE